MASFWRLFKEGGIWNWPLLLLFSIALPLTVGLGVVAIRKKGFPAWTLLIAPLVFEMMAWFGHATDTMKIRRALEGGGIDAAQKARILAEGTSETMSVLVFASVYASFVLSLAAVLIGVRALRHGPRLRFAWSTYAALGGGLVLLVVACALRILLTKVLGGWMPRRGELVPPILSLFGAVAGVAAATCAAPALATEEGDPPAHAEIGKDAFVALAAAALAVLGGVAQEYVRSWANVLGAVSGESVDPLQTVRIFEEGGREAGAMATGSAMLLLPIAVAGLFAAAPKMGALLRGVVRGWPAAIAFVAIGLMLGVLPRARIASAIMELATTSLVEWPKGLEPVTVRDETNLARAGGLIVFFDAERAWVDGIERKAALTNPAECVAQIRRLSSGPFSSYTTALAPDARTPAPIVYCLASAADGARRATPTVSFVVQVDSPVTHGKPMTVALGAVEVASAEEAAGEAAYSPHLHLTKKGWRYRSSPQDPEQTGTSGSPDFPSTGFYSGPKIVVTYDPDLTARDLLAALARGKNGQRFVLGPPDAKAFDPPPSPIATGTSTIGPRPRPGGLR
jgi:hypothetical protein